MLVEDVIVKDGRVRTKDSIMECPHCKSTFQKDHVRTRMKKWGKDKQSFYSTKHCPNCDKRILLRDDNPDIESVNTRLSKLRTYCNYCKMNGQFDEYRDAMSEMLELQKQIEDMRNGEMSMKVKDAFPVGAKVKYVGKYADPALTNARATIVGAGNDKGVGGGNMVRIRFDNGREAIVPYMDVEHTNDSKIKDKKTKDSDYDLGSGHLGNGITVWNRKQQEHGDYKKIAHIGPDRKITWYISNPPSEVKSYVDGIANGPNLGVSTSQPYLKVFNDSKIKDNKSDWQVKYIASGYGTLSDWSDNKNNAIKEFNRVKFLSKEQIGEEMGLNDDLIPRISEIRLVDDKGSTVQSYRVRDSKPTAKDRMLKGLDLLKRRVKDAFGMNTEEQQKEFDVRDIEEETIKNNAFRRVVFTGNTLQLVLMSLLPNEDIGMEVHDKVDQFFRIEKGEGLLEIEGQGSQPVKDGFSILITAGTKHNVKNIGSEPLKLYTIYGPPNHPPDRLQKTKEEAMAAEGKKTGDKKTKDEGKYKIYWINHGYYSQEEFNTLEEARKYADSKSFEYRIDLNGKPVASGGTLRGFRMMNKKTKDKMISYRGQMIDVGAGSMGDWSSICSIPKNPTNPIMAWGKTEQEAIENIKPKIDKVLSNKTKDAAKLALDSLAKLKKW